MVTCNSNADVSMLNIVISTEINRQQQWVNDLRWWQEILTERTGMRSYTNQRISRKKTASWQWKTNPSVLIQSLLFLPSLSSQVLWAREWSVFEVVYLKKQPAHFGKGFLVFISDSQRRTVPLAVSYLWIQILNDHLLVFNTFNSLPAIYRIQNHWFQIVHSFQMQDTGIFQTVGSSSK